MVGDRMQRQALANIVGFSQSIASRYPRYTAYG